MEIEKNTLSRDWIVSHEGRTFHVNLEASECEDRLLSNPVACEVYEETVDGAEKLVAYLHLGGSAGKHELYSQDAATVNEVIAFCISNWHNAFMQELKETMETQKERIEG